MITPPYLRKGDRVGIVAPARFVNPEEIEPAIAQIEQWGVEVVRGANLYARHNQSAGTDEQRIADLQAMMDNDTISAIICARGGYGTIRIIDKLDFRHLVSRPKWIVGYSDITVLHSHLEKQLNLESLHAPMLLGYDGRSDSVASMEMLRKALFGEALEYKILPGRFSRSGSAQATLTGGNLSLLIALAGSESEVNTNEKVLFIEDVDEYLYHIDRMMHQLKRSGKLKNLAGLVVGGLSKMRDNKLPFGKTAEEIIFEAVEEYDFPVLVGFPAGHDALNYPLIMGRTIHLTVGKEIANLQFHQKTAGSSQSKTAFKFFKSLFFISALFAMIYFLYYFAVTLLLK